MLLFEVGGQITSAHRDTRGNNWFRILDKPTQIKAYVVLG